MKINVGSAGRKSSHGRQDVVALVVLAAEIFAFAQLTGMQAWLGTVVHSDVVRIGICTAVLAALSIWGLALWPRVHGAIAWMIWILGFGAIGAFFSYLWIARHFGGGVSIIYGSLFLAAAMIGVAGLARSMLT
jgi:hypothetical protein